MFAATTWAFVQSNVSPVFVVLCSMFGRSLGVTLPAVEFTTQTRGLACGSTQVVVRLRGPSRWRICGNCMHHEFHCLPSVYDYIISAATTPLPFACGRTLSRPLPHLQHTPVNMPRTLTDTRLARWEAWLWVKGAGSRIGRLSSLIVSFVAAIGLVAVAAGGVVVEDLGVSGRTVACTARGGRAKSFICLCGCLWGHTGRPGRRGKYGFAG